MDKSVKYYYDLHCHTSECSACSRISAKEIVEYHSKAGYNGLVFTDHCGRGNTCVDRTMPWEKQVDCFYNAYLSAKPLADSLGINLMFGLEYSQGRGKECLLYGIDKDVLLQMDGERFNKGDLEHICNIVHKNGGLVIAAHPFRTRDYIENPDEPPELNLVDGAEQINAGDRQEDDIKNLAYAKNHPLIIHTAGSDRHSPIEGLIAGMAFDRKISDIKDLVKALKNREGKPFCKGKLELED